MGLAIQKVDVALGKVFGRLGGEKKIGCLPNFIQTNEMSAAEINVKSKMKVKQVEKPENI